MATITTVPYADWPDNVKAAVKGTEDGVAGWGGKVFTVRKVTMTSDLESLTATDVGLPAGKQIGQVLPDRFRWQSSSGGPVQPCPVRWDPGRHALIAELPGRTMPGASGNPTSVGGRTVSPLLAGVQGIATFIAA